ncbi:hypothetical protein ACFPOD_01275 [Nitratireductor kimnyeongensis]|uniref:LysE type translocator n=1 Tax=Nitratireductor kimnyeongensis TaxID=430679 RepID=A0ABW0T305_9HYPH|nr:hypothetical protein [Nitratireductor kimnyeongensis]QZZ35230.1 hypothetical protein KW403_15925 [Nitratireductor kimnyeongensis]
MSTQLWLAFILASLPVHFSPGPNNTLALSRTIRMGYWTGHPGSLGRYPAYLLIFLAAGCYCLFGAGLGRAANGKGILSWVTRGLGAVLIGFSVLLAAT